MSGIIGVFGPCEPNEDAATLQRMLDSVLRHVSCSSSTYLNPDLEISSGFVHPEPNGTPALMWNAARTIGCFVAGEVFTESGGESDVAADLARLYEKQGVRALESLNGRFGGLLIDLPRREGLLFNDRYGLGRIYVHENERRVLFASEAKALLAAVPALRTLDPRGLGEWLSCGCALENRTLFRGISLLPPASAWVFSADGGLKKQFYFTPSAWENQAPLSPGDFSNRLADTFPKILTRYTNGNCQIGMSLTGGLDGRMIMAWARPERGALPCYTFNGSHRDCADVRIARKVAAVCGQSHQTITVGDDFLGQFPRLAEEAVRITDGAMDVTGAAELYVNRLARQIAPVRLTGNYGSEILRRHVAFGPRPLPIEVFSSDFAPLLPAAAQTYSEIAGGNRLSFIAFKQVPWHHYSRLAVEQSQLNVRSPFLDNDLVALAFQAPPEAATSLGPSLRLIAQGNPALGRIPTDRGITYPADRVTNRLHRSFQEFLAKAEYAYDYGMPNWLARVDKYLAPLRLEKLFLGRQKFCHFRTWYRHRLAPYVKEVLLDPRSRSRFYVNGPAVERLVNAHTAGTSNHTVEIHKLLSLELLHRTLLDS